uniref:Septin-type G domain-containing protein n=1 Tax=Ganoderma boninense TaxID=34458 RepID=A0A5K1K275_9APHY|nr:Septin-type G domain-containing protein [Ganoderma boninense]
MPKPTLIQSILNRPSQSYHHPTQREYHSTRGELFRLAHATAKIIPGQYDDSGLDTSTPGDSDTETYHSSATFDRSSQRPSSKSRAPSSHSGSDLSQSQRTTEPKRNPAHSIASTSSFVSVKNPDDNRSHTRKSSSNAPSYQSRSSSSRDPSTKGNEGDVEESTDEDEEGTDIFYTPRTSLASSSALSRVSLSAVAMLETPVLASSLLPLHSKSKLVSQPTASNDDTPPVSRTPSGSSLSSVASSTSGGDDSPSLFSEPSRGTSTRPTTAGSSERGAKHAASSVETITIASSISRSRTLSAGAKSAGSTSSARSGASTIRKHREEAGKLTYTDEDWAKDIRWLTPPKMPAASNGRRTARTLPPDLPSLENDLSGRRRPGHPNPRAKGDRRSKRSRHSRGRMSALWEEDESEDGSTDFTSSEPSRSTTPIPETPPHSIPSSPLAKITTLPLTAEPQEENAPSESTHSESTPDARLERYARGNRRTYSTTSSLFRPNGSSNAHLPTYPLPNPVPSSPATPTPNGYTGLILPHAGYSNAKGKQTAEGHVDLVRAGVAQSSMATIEVIRGVATTISNGAPLSANNSPSKPRRTLSFSLGRSFTLSFKGKKRESATPVHLRGGLPLPVAFTAHVAPPSFVPESHVLVQVHAVGLDTLDSLIVHDKAGLNGNGGGLTGGKGIGGGKAGFIPGRSFAGKVIECGWAVREEVCRRGEWVVGLLDVKKCGGLAEFILVERHRVHRAPQPRPRTPAPLFQPRKRTHLRSASLPLNGQSYTSSPLAPPALTVEELALLPLCGVPAHRAIRTFADVLTPPLGTKSSDPPNASDKRALILRGHDGAGALAVQMLHKRGVRVAVQIPESAMVDDEPSAAEDSTPPQIANGNANGHGRKLSLDLVRPSPSKSDKDKDKGKAKEGQKPKQTKQARTEARLRAWGVEDIFVGEPLDVLRQLAEDGQSFDMVLDTVGGAAVWEAGQRLLTADWTAAASRSSLSLGRVGSRNGSLDVDLGADPAAMGANAESHTKLKRGRSTSKGRSVITHAQFTTLVGDTPHRPIPTAQDNLKGGLRSLRRATSTTSKSTPAVLTRGVSKREKRLVGYAWVSVAADVDMEGEDVRDSLAAVVRMAESGWLRPPCVDAEGESQEPGKIVPFEKAPEVFRRGIIGPLGVLADGGTCAVRIVG